MSTDFIRIAKISGAHALKGGMRIDIVSDIAGRFEKGAVVYVEKGAEMCPMTVQSFSPSGRSGIIFLEGIADRNASELMKGKQIYISKAQAEDSRKDLSDDEFYYFDLIGCTVLKDGAEFGEVSGITQAGNDLLVIKRGDREYLIPFVESMVNTDRLAERIVEIFPIPGLFED